jgi:hypothetical protein
MRNVQITKRGTRSPAPVNTIRSTSSSEIGVTPSMSASTPTPNSALSSVIASSSTLLRRAERRA